MLYIDKSIPKLGCWCIVIYSKDIYKCVCVYSDSTSPFISFYFISNNTKYVYVEFNNCEGRFHVNFMENINNPSLKIGKRFKFFRVPAFKLLITSVHH